MNPREIAEIKRRLNPDKAFPTIIRGMYTTDDGQIISEFTLDPGRLSQDENEKYMSLFKKMKEHIARLQWMKQRKYLKQMIMIHISFWMLDVQMNLQKDIFQKRLMLLMNRLALNL